MINLLIEVYDPEGAVTLYDTVRVYSDTDQYGAFTNIVVDLPLVQNQVEYEYTDKVNVPTWYEVSYFDTTDSTESLRTGPVPGMLQGGPAIFTQGPLGVLTIGYVRTMTTFAAIANLSDAQIAELIIRAETLLQNFADKYGGWNYGYPNFQILQCILARILLEEIYLRSSPQYRSMMAGNLMAEQLGSYSYKRGQWPQGANQNTYPGNLMTYFSPESQKLLFDLVAESPFHIFFTTTQVFRELIPKENADKQLIRPDWDGWEREIGWHQRLYQYLPAQRLDRPTYLLAPWRGIGTYGFWRVTG